MSLIIFVGGNMSAPARTVPWGTNCLEPHVNNKQRLKGGPMAHPHIVRTRFYDCAVAIFATMLFPFTYAQTSQGENCSLLKTVGQPSFLCLHALSFKLPPGAEVRPAELKAIQNEPLCIPGRGTNQKWIRHSLRQNACRNASMNQAAHVSGGKLWWGWQKLLFQV